MDDLITNKSELIIDALQYAHDNDLDVSNKNDVLKILDVLDPDHTEDADEFMRLLNTSDMFMNITAKENEDKKN
jgi:hypothetical protein